MSHLNEGQLQAYLDGQLEGAAVRSLSAHLEACAVCAATLATMRATAARAARALAWLDRPASTAATLDEGSAARVAGGAPEVVGANGDAVVRRIEAHRSWGRPARVGFLKAAMLVLVLSGAAAAAIPGSPVQRWLGGAWDRITSSAREDAAPVQPTAPAVDEPAATPAAPVELASISIEPVDGTVRVVLEGAERVQAIRVELVDARSAAVATDADAGTRFSTGPSRIQASGLGSGIVTVSLPRTLARATVVADGHVLLEKQGETLRTPGSVIERTQDTIVFRTH